MQVDDGDRCTSDSCDPVKGVRHTPVTTDPNCAKWYSGGLKVEVRTNYCDPQKVQQYFQVTNTGSSPIKLSDISIKYWVYDTTAANVVSDIYYAGCVVTSPTNLTCEHPVTGVATTGIQPSACVGDVNQQANWEVTLTPTDNYALQPGHQWNNIQTVVHLNNWAKFVPGTTQWYSTCLTNPDFAGDAHFTVYYKGNLVFNSGINAPACAAPHGTQQLRGHITPAMAAAPVAGPVPGTRVITVALGLPITVPNDGSQSIDDYIRDISNPRSQNFGDHLDVKGFASRYGSPSADALGDWARSHGLTVIRTFPNNLLVMVSGTASAIAQALYVNVNYYNRPDGTRFYAPDREPSLDFGPTVSHVSRLDDMFVGKPLNGTGYADGFTRIEGPNAYLGRDLRNAYASCHLSLTGAGQAVGLVAPNGFSIADLDAYSRANLGVPFNTSQVKTVFTDPTYQQCAFPPIYCSDGTQCRVDPACSRLGYAACCPNDNPVTSCRPPCDQTKTGCLNSGSACPDPTDGETPLDMAMVFGMAPGVTIVMFEGTRDATMLHAMANYTDIAISQFSSSWSVYLDENGIAALKQMAAQRRSLFQASGDSGAIADPGFDLRDSDLVTDVGGTHLLMNGNGDSWQSESVADFSGGFYTEGNAHNGAASSPKPEYQGFINMEDNNRGGDNRYRNVPDVAALADNVQVYVGTDPVYNVIDPRKNEAGTSVSAPVWAGFSALVNEHRSQQGLVSLGWANPLLYAIAQDTAAYNSGFNDIGVAGGVTGRTSCTVDGTFCFPYDPTGGFHAVTGYDLATGLGTPKCTLIDLLDASPQSRHVTLTVSTEFQTCHCNVSCSQPSGTIAVVSASASCDLTSSNVTCKISIPREQLCLEDLGLYADANLTLQNDGSVRVCPWVYWDDGGSCGSDGGDKWSGSGPCTVVAPNANVNIDTSGLSAQDSGSCCGGASGCPTYEHTAIRVSNDIAL